MTVWRGDTATSKYISQLTPNWEHTISTWADGENVKTQVEYTFFTAHPDASNRENNITNYYIALQ